ncbi:MAG: type III secretion system cytoplasmic ring protein SctQ [Pseudomonadota bacterium]
MSLHNIPPWKADFMSPMEGLVRNALHTRIQPWTVHIADVPCHVHAPLYSVDSGDGRGQGSVALKPLESVAFYLIVHLGTDRWIVELGQGFPLTLHPAVADVPDDSLLPAPLRLALMELLVAPLADAFGTFMDMRVTCEIVGLELHGAMDNIADGGDGANLEAIQAMLKQAHCAVPLTLTVPATNSSQASTVPCIVHIFGQASASHLYQKVSGLPPHIHDIAGLSVPVSIEAGSIALTTAELAALETDDILLPDSYPAREGRITLRMSQCVMPCVLDQANATVEAIVPISSPMSQHVDGGNPVPPEQNQNDAAQVSADAVHIAALDVTMTFELERRTMSLGELSMISPGYTFALGVDALAPVTLRVGDKVLGTGRLVDLGGTMGVQVTSLADNAKVRKPVETTVAASAVQEDAGAEKRPVRGLASFKQEQTSPIMEPRSGDYA